MLNRRFIEAIVMRNRNGIRHLLEAGADVDARDEEHDEAAIILAVKFGDAEIVELLLNEGAKVEARDDQGRTALFFADVGSKVFATLVAAAANINAKDNEGNTILMQNVSRSSSAADVDELLRLGVEPNVRNRAGESALDLALELGLVNIIERLRSSSDG